jgi:hypothetical protein
MTDKAIDPMVIDAMDVERRPAWRVRPKAAGAQKRKAGSWLTALWPRREPTLYQRCLAVHIHYAGPRSGLS